LLDHNLFQAARAAGGMEEELTLWAVVQGTEKRHPLNVIPMKVRDEDVGGKWLWAELTLQCMAEHTESRAAVEDVDLISDANFHAGGIASVAQVLGLWSGRGAAHAPKLNSHKSRMTPVLDDLLNNNLPVKTLIIRGILEILAIVERVTK